MVYAGTHGGHGPRPPGGDEARLAPSPPRPPRQPGFPPSRARASTCPATRSQTQLHARAQHRQHLRADLHGRRACRACRSRVRSSGQTFPPVDYVALPVAHKTLYVAWLDPATHAIVDAFVMNFKTGVVFDYAPGSAHARELGHGEDPHEGREPDPVARRIEAVLEARTVDPRPPALRVGGRSRSRAESCGDLLVGIRTGARGWSEAGRLASERPGRHSVAGRIGRGSKPPPQLGQTSCSACSTQSAQKVHS